VYRGFRGKGSVLPDPRSAGSLVLTRKTVPLVQDAGGESCAHLVDFSFRLGERRQRLHFGEKRVDHARTYGAGICEAFEVMAAQNPLVRILENLTGSMPFTLERISALARRVGLQARKLSGPTDLADVIISQSP